LPGEARRVGAGLLQRVEPRISGFGLSILVLVIGRARFSDKT